MNDPQQWHGTTILMVRKGGKVVVAGDGQVSLGQTIIKSNARKVRPLAGGQVIAGFAGATADAMTLFERLEAKLEEYPLQLTRACVELAKDWRTDRYLRRLEAMMIVADKQTSLVLTGTGDVLEPENGVVGIGSGGNYALAAARALIDSDMDAEAIVRKAMAVAAEICVYTNTQITVESLLMLTRDDLDAAVTTGVITTAQSERILSIAAERRTLRAKSWVRDERFVFMKSFNEFFIAIGVALLGVGLAAACATLPILVFAYPLAMWGLAEYLTGRLRLTLPSIVTLVFIAVSVVALSGYLLGPIESTQGLGTAAWNWGPRRASLSAATALAILLIHYWRFRLPFALLLIPASVAWLLVSVGHAFMEGSTTASAVFVGVGLAAFGTAMAYDISDRERLTRRADCAFWLNLIAAPLIVHPIATAIWSQDTMAPSTALEILAIVAIFAFVALAIDRRAMLVSSLGYLGGTLIYIVSSISAQSEVPVWITLLLLGTLVVSLGVAWQRVRAVVLQLVPATLHPWLPPVRIG